MSVESMSLVLNHSRSEGTAKLILIGIANHDGDGGSWPAVGTLAKYANVTERTVQRHINTLIELGEIERVINDGGNHKTPNHMRPNLYRILLRCPNNCDRTTKHKLTDDVSDPPTPVSPPDTSVTPPPDTDVTPPVTQVSPEPSFNHPLNHDVVSTSPAELPKRRGWWPSDAAMATAKELDPVTDIPLHVTRYRVVKAERKAQCDSAEWLRWFIEDEKKARAEQAKEQASRFRKRGWADVAE